MLYLNVKTWFIYFWEGVGGTLQQGLDPRHYPISPERAAPQGGGWNNDCLWRANGWILTNWNSVADPAPASAFLSAPAGKRNNNLRIVRGCELLQTEGRPVFRPNPAGKAMPANVHHEAHVKYTQWWETLLPPLLWQPS